MPTSNVTITHPMDDDEIGAALAALMTVHEPVADVPAYRWYRPLVSAADEYANFAHTKDARIYTGIEEFDTAMRGVAPGEMCLVQGFTHSSKTVFVTTVAAYNRHRRIAWFTPDETQVLVLVKLACAYHGVSAEWLEERLGADDEAARKMLMDTAQRVFPNLIVFDQSLGIAQMSKAIEEAEEVWGAPCEMAVYDYARLLPEGEDVPSKISTLKAWGKKHGVPLFLLTQSSRTAGKDGQKVTIDSGEYGGEMQATFVVGVRRKKSEFGAAIREIDEKLKGNPRDPDALVERKRELEYDLLCHTNSITWSLVKNKRPPCRLVDDKDFTLDPNTGRVRPYEIPRRAPAPVSAAHTDPTWDEEF